MLKDEYLRIVQKIQKMRYFNVRRTGSILCRKCKMVSQTPTLHVEHVSGRHPELAGYCPYCQRELVSGLGGRITKKSTQHLKFCCFFHKIENSKYRRIFNIAGGPKLSNGCDEQTDEGGRIYKTSILTLQRSVNDERYLLNVLEYEAHRDSVYSPPQSTMPTSLSHRWHAIVNFHRDYALNGTRERYPAWLLNIDIDLKASSSIRRLVATSTLEFHPRENIDCQLVRVLSLQWTKYRVYKCVFVYTEFIANIDLMMKLVRTQCIAVTRYMHIYKANDSYMIDMIIVRPRDDCVNIREIISILKNMNAIETFDTFIDTCCDLSSLNNDPMRFPCVEKFQLLGLTYDQDVMLPSSAIQHSYPAVPSSTLSSSSSSSLTSISSSSVASSSFANVTSSTQPQYNSTVMQMVNRRLDNMANGGSGLQEQLSTREVNVYTIPENYLNNGKLGYHEFLSPLSKHAAVHMYALTEYGCVHAFNRLLRYSNFVNQIPNVTQDKRLRFVLRYSSMEADKRIQNYTISLCNGETFANEQYYRSQTFNARNLGDGGGDKVFVIDPNNIKLVTSVSASNTPSDELTLFPNMLFVTSAKYILTARQVEIYKVAQYNREKILMEINNVPTTTAITAAEAMDSV